MMSDEPSEKHNVQSNATSPRVNDEFTLGYNRDFEALWWRIEITIWVVLSVFVLVALTGLLGHGPLARQRRGSEDGLLDVDFQRVARYKTPDVMTVRLDPALYREGKIHLWLNRAIVEQMGLQRIIPQPIESFPGDEGIAYVFPVQDATRPTLIWFAKEPSKPGIYTEEVRVDSKHDLFLRSITLP
jgi:hypothetical protein